jgi:hypothetical protein
VNHDTVVVFVPRDFVRTFVDGLLRVTLRQARAICHFMRDFEPNAALYHQPCLPEFIAALGGVRFGHARETA